MRSIPASVIGDNNPKGSKLLATHFKTMRFVALSK